MLFPAFLVVASALEASHNTEKDFAADCGRDR
jgi:hypothetical protein